MYKILFCLAFTLQGPLSLWSQSRNYPFEIVGSISGANNSTIILEEWNPNVRNEKIKKFQTRTDFLGNFTLTDSITYFGEYLFYIRGKSEIKRIFLDTTTIRIKGSIDSLNALDIKSTLNDSLFRQFLKQNSSIYRQYTNIINKGISLQTNLAYDTLMLYTSRERYNVTRKIPKDIYKSIISKADTYLCDALRNYYMYYLEHYPYTYPTVRICEDLASHHKIYSYFNKQKILKALDSLPEQIKESAYFQNCYGKIYSLGRWQVNSKFPSIKVPDSAGHIISSEKLIQGSKYLLIDFWASWCGPCIKENREVKKIYDDLPKGYLEVFSITIDQKKNEWLNALKREGFPWPQGYGYQNVTVNLFNTTTIPLNYLVDNSGNIIKINITHSELRDFLLQEIAKKNPNF